MPKFFLESFTGFFIVAGVVTHPIWNWSFKTGFIPKPSDFFFVLAIAGAAFYFLGGGRHTLSRVPKLLYAALFLFGASILIGTAAGYIRYGIPVGGWHLIGYHLLRIGGGFVLCLFSYIALKEHLRFGHRLYIAFVASSLVFLFLFVFSLAKNAYYMFSYGRFLGLAGNPGMFAILVFPSFVFVFFLFLRALFAGNAKNRAFQFLSFALLWIVLEMLILWSGTRSYFGAVMLAVIVGSVLMGRFYRVGLGKVFVFTMLVGLGAFLILFLFPVSAQRFKLLGQQYPAFLQESQEQAGQIRHFVELQTSEELSEIPQMQASDMDSRWRGFQYYFSLLKADPLAFLLGLGINYEYKFSLLIFSGRDALPVGRSIIFDIFLYGGVGAALSLLLLGYMILLRTKALFRREKEPADDPIYVLAPAVTLLGWWSAAVFLGTPFTMIPNWILLAMALANSTPKSQNAK